MTPNRDKFIRSAIAHHVAQGNLTLSADTGRVTLGPTGREWFAKRTKDGRAEIERAHKAMREGADNVELFGTRYPLTPIDAKALRLPRTIKTYLAAEYCDPRTNVSRVCYSALWV